MDRGAWWATVHEVTKSRTRVSNFTFTFIKRLITSSSLSAISVKSSAYLRLLIFFLAILIMVVKVVSDDSELKMEVYSSASDKKECVGEK